MTSLTFNYVSKKCNLSRDTLTDGISQSGRSLLYSELGWFSSELEPDCYGRPCGDNQVCVPGRLADGNTVDCSYTCLNVSGPVCPLPEKLNGPRTAGSINTVSCNAWETGGGTATCGNDLKWNAVIKRCRPIFKLECNDDAVCAPINAQCLSGGCKCGTLTSYNSTEHLCVEALCVTSEYLVNGASPVLDSQLSVSSVWNNINVLCRAPGARLNTQPSLTTSGSWCAAENDKNQFIQVEFNRMVHVTGIALQGRPSNPQYVTSYKFQYSQNCDNFTTFLSTDGTEMVFQGNTDQDTVVTSLLPNQITAKCVRINPQTWFHHISLRFDILGCY
ncbi:lactadherin-like [Mya arenaria]|uniref:lactadherin-like n=1 Tax=Mya arenaria TaxID=6604 RepID=UPI0022E38E92|nr:lactadherin-like [Mya arenaria]